MVAPLVGHFAGEEPTYPQHLKKFVKKVGAAKVRQTPMIKGYSEVSRRTAHSDPYLTKGDVRDRLSKQRWRPHNMPSRPLFSRENCAGSKNERELGSAADRGRGLPRAHHSRPG